MTKIIALSGRLQSGKNTVANLIEKIYINRLFEVKFLNGNETGKLGYEITIEIDGKNCPLVKQYSFAYWLKFVCHKVLGLTHEQCYGGNEDKNTLTHLLWENAPNNYRQDGVYEKYNKTGNMTAREVLQWWGSEVFRNAYNNVWVDSTIQQIKDEEPILAIITDCRFLNEVEGVQREKGMAIRLTRNSNVKSEHISETNLDNYNNFDYILNNENLGLATQELAVYNMMKKLDII